MTVETSLLTRLAVIGNNALRIHQTAANTLLTPEERAQLWSYRLLPTVNRDLTETMILTLYAKRFIKG